jgi:5'-methylthioadenosine phosphorylase
MARHLAPGDLVALDQVMDFTQGARDATFFDGDEVVHIDFTEPYCPELRKALLHGAEGADVPLHPRGTYLCVNGPRLESRAEIAFFARTGAHVIGMTGMPEAALAREAEICFAALGVVTNHAAGLGREPVTTTEVVTAMRTANEQLGRVLARAIPLIPRARSCPCGQALKDARMG